MSEPLTEKQLRHLVQEEIMRLSTRPVSVENVEGETSKGGIPQLLRRVEELRSQARARLQWEPGMWLSFPFSVKDGHQRLYRGNMPRNS